MQATQIQLLGWEDPLKKEMATHSSMLAWEIPWTEELDWLQMMGWQVAGCDLGSKQQQQQIFFYQAVLASETANEIRLIQSFYLI